MDNEQVTSYPVEFLNSLALSGVPSHKLRLKIGVPVLLMRNLDAPRLCNGTRLQIMHLSSNIIQATIMTDIARGWLGKGLTKAGLQEQGEDGKTELSVLHFALMNPNWEPPQASNAFIQNLREQVNTAKDQYPGLDSNPFYNSLNSVSTMGSKYASLANSIHQSKHQSFPRPEDSSLSTGLRTDRVVMTGLSQAEGPPYLSQNGIWTR
ncbi:hypothetical protein AVEN_24932-1 [Araneus ventricosus]|uniref:DNA helicase Pif1-like 2B domain-containing protein n=1 Tax=Araneus ventricosus TaxID=182803 RepID=A0A4Y2P7D1_ARAVE|nr:hypothetical protein AVEN_24932-1 [Araneus ventricosus]